MKLDYGSGRQPKEGFLSSDFCGSPNYDFFIQDYKVLGTPDYSCDVVHCRNVIHHIPECDLSKLFAELDRLLKPNGTLIISEPRKENHKQNLILDLLWYRFLTCDEKIMIPYEYVDYKQYLGNFEIVKSEDEYNNEILTLKKINCNHVWTLVDSVQEPCGDLHLHRECKYCDEKEVYTVDNRRY